MTSVHSLFPSSRVAAHSGLGAGRLPICGTSALRASGGGTLIDIAQLKEVNRPARKRRGWCVGWKINLVMVSPETDYRRNHRALCRCEGCFTSDISPTRLACPARRMTIRSTRHGGCVTITGKCRRAGRLPLHGVLNVITHLVTRVSVYHVFVCVPCYVNGTLSSISDLRRRQATRETTQTTKPQTAMIQYFCSLNIPLMQLRMNNTRSLVHSPLVIPTGLLVEETRCYNSSRGYDDPNVLNVISHT